MDAVIKYLEKNVVAKTSELQKITHNRVAVIRLAEKGVIQSIARGYYSLPRFDIFDAMLVLVSKYYKIAIISGIVAARVYDLTDENIEKIDVDIPNTKNINNTFLNVRRTDKSKITGVVTKDVLGNKIKIYDVERTLADIKIKYSSAIFYKALKRYIKKYKPNFEKIKKYDAVLSTNILSSVMQELADG
jgi:predicted transcriptional regulator of viral defense system